MNEVSDTGIDVPELPECPVPVLMLYRIYRSGAKVCIATGGPGTDIVSNVRKCLVRIWMSYRTYQGVRYRYGCRIERTEVSGTGIDVALKLPKCQVPALMYPTYRSVLYRYSCRPERTEVSGNGIDVVPAPIPLPAPVQTRVYIPAVYVQSKLYPAFHGGT